MDPLPRFPDNDLIEFEDWATVDIAAATLGVTQSRVRQMIADRNFSEIAIVGSRPTYLVTYTEIERIKTHLEARDAEHEQRRIEREVELAKKGR